MTRKLTQELLNDLHRTMLIHLKLTATIATHTPFLNHILFDLNFSFHAPHNVVGDIKYGWYSRSTNIRPILQFFAKIDSDYYFKCEYDNNDCRWKSYRICKEEFDEPYLSREKC